MKGASGMFELHGQRAGWAFDAVRSYSEASSRAISAVVFLCGRTKKTGCAFSVFMYIN